MKVNSTPALSSTGPCSLLRLPNGLCSPRGPPAAARAAQRATLTAGQPLPWVHRSQQPFFGHRAGTSLLSAADRRQPKGTGRSGVRAGAERKGPEGTEQGAGTAEVSGQPSLERPTCPGTRTSLRQTSVIPTPWCSIQSPQTSCETEEAASRPPFAVTQQHCHCSGVQG